ncbi:hypothetical protein Trco_004395 [Trichoderma cornu-damae]|uniref:Required for respiratory growth protein 9, mitochondrial n=1 Tax=Trichoderma cornu-damae TaxID=654480 RepID=A0A9P8QT63_9HYPO|nr:hypothetical protein Trco_004395 [Trichoderma cornu-damae]
MSCSCRAAAPWRTFARGLSQIHRSEPSSAAVPFRWPAERRLVVWGQNRRLHASGLSRQDGAAVAERLEEVASHTAIAEATRAPTAKTLDESTPRTDARASGQQMERKRARRDRNGRRGATLTDDAEANVHGEGGDGSRGTPSSKARRERKAKSTPAASYSRKDDSSEPSSRPKPRNQEPWQLQKAALKEKFPEGWQPRKRLSPDALAGIRALNAQFPDVYTTNALAEKFQVSPEAIRRILKSSWRPSGQEDEDRQQRWFRRGKQVWEQKAALGIKPPQRWRMEGIARDPSYHEWSKRASQREREWEEEETQKYRAYREKMKKKEDKRKKTPEKPEKPEGKKGRKGW